MELQPELNEFLKAVTSETRQRILFLFADGQERSVGQIASELDIVASTASEHLAMLKRGGLLVASRNGKETYYRPNRSNMVLLLRKLSDCLKICCPISAGRRKLSECAEAVAKVGNLRSTRRKVPRTA